MFVAIALYLNHCFKQTNKKKKTHLMFFLIDCFLSDSRFSPVDIFQKVKAGVPIITAPNKNSVQHICKLYNRNPIKNILVMPDLFSQTQSRSFRENRSVPKPLHQQINSHTT